MKNKIVIFAVLSVFIFVFSNTFSLLKKEDGVMINESYVKPSRIFKDRRVADLILAASDNNVAEVSRLVRDGVDVNAVGVQGVTPLIFLIHADKPSVHGVDLLLKYGANPNLFPSKGFFQQYSPIYLAAGKGHPEIVELLIKYGGDPNVRSRSPTDVKKTALMHAASEGCVKNMDVLLKHSADINAVDGDGFTALFLAIVGRRYDSVYYLLNKGIDYKNFIKSTDKYFLNLKLSEVLENASTAYFDEDQKKYQKKVYAWLKARGVIVHPKKNIFDEELNKPSEPDNPSIKSYAIEDVQRDPNALGKKVMIKPKGEYQSIDLSDTDQMILKLLSDNSTENKNAIEEVKSKPEKYSPLVLLAMSTPLYKDDRPEEALFWYALGDLRAACDAEKSKDLSVLDGISPHRKRLALNASEIQNYAIDHPEESKALMLRVLDWDKNHKRDYDIKWVSLFGIGAFVDEKIKFYPKSEWSKIDEKCRNEYHTQFLKFVNKD